MQKTARATKKQRELLAFIDGFIKGNNYGPSYREIMRGLGYKSVSTVATHVDGLIVAGFLRKKDNSARSIEVVRLNHAAEPDNEHEIWLRKAVKKKLTDELNEPDTQALVRAMELLGYPLTQTEDDKTISTM